MSLFRLILVTKNRHIDMASRHDIISITFQANAAKANVALQALQGEAKKSSDRVKDLKRQLEEGLRANMPTDQLQRIRDNIKQAEREVKQWGGAYKELTKGVRTLDEAVKQFNAGTMGQMSAAFNKAAANAAKLAQTKMAPGTKEWKEMDALIVESQSNVLKATADINGLVSAIQKGGTSTKSTLTQAKNDLQQLLTLEVRGSAEWNTYNKQLKTVESELLKLAQAEQRAAQADQTAIMTKRMGSLKTMSASTLAETRRYWEQMVASTDKGSLELAKYEANLKKVVNQERSRSAVGAEQVLGNMNKFGIEQVRSAVQEMTRLRDTTQTGIPTWQHYNRLIKEGEAYLTEYAEREKIARGEALSLANALKLSATAGGKDFQGTAQQLQMAEQAIQKALVTAKKGSPEWKQYQEALSRVRVEMQNAGMTSEKMQEILARPANAKNLNELQAAVKRAKAELSLMEETVGKNNAKYQELASQTKKAEFQMKQMQAAASGTASSFDKAWSRLKTYIGLYMGAAVAIQKLVATMGDLMELSDKMGEVRKTTGFTSEEVGHLTENLKKLDTRTSINGLLELSAAAGQLGLKSEQDVQGFTEAANKLMVALPEMGREGATQMLKVALATGEIDKIQRQMNEGTISGSSAVAVAMEKVGSTIDRLRASSASAAPAITDFVQRVGAVGAQSGISIDQIAALGSTVDALGMRVEMSATALSRMIPAIRANAFDVAHAIGVTPNTLRDLFDAGRGMEAILLILQHIKDSGMDTDSIESMLGMGNMKEVMKELNQHGARAGIVFAGLSQNVDELRRQLGVASEAYEQNIAIQMEYDKMNETTAAKWARLKNQVEEMFVGDTPQRVLGSVIDGLRSLVDFISGNVNPVLQVLSVTVKSILIAWATFKLALGETLFIKSISGLKSLKDSLLLLSMYTKENIVLSWKLVFAHTAQEKAAIRAAIAQKGLNSSMMANVWLAVAAAIFYVCMKLYEYANATDELTKTLADLENEYANAERQVNQLVSSLKQSTTEADNAKNKHKELETQTAALRKEVETLKNSTDKGTEATAKLSEKQKELENKERALKAATDESNKANDTRLKLIQEINSKYSSYLGYMLSEKTAAEQVASAHQLIVAALKEEMRQKGINRKREAIDAKYAEKEKEYSQDSLDELSSLPQPTRQRIMDAWTKVRANIKSDIDQNGKQTFSLNKIDGIRHSGATFNTQKELENYLKQAFAEIVRENTKTLASVGKVYLVKSDVGHDVFNRYIDKMWGGNILNDGFGDWASTTISKEVEIARELRQDQITQSEDHRNTVKAAVNDISSNYRAITKTLSGKQKLTDDQINRLAENVNAIVVDLTRYGSSIQNVGKYVGNNNAISHENAVNTMFANLDKNTRQRILSAARNASRAGTGNGTGGNSNTIRGNYNVSNPWGSTSKDTSTDYGEWDVNELVARRDQMDKFKNILKPDTDVRAVLAEDKALMKALDNGLKNDWKSVLGWYNQERLKIQNELKSERFSTNKGHWRDEQTKGGRRRRNPLYESDYALAELDRYYSRRKEALEKARSSENISEEVYNRQTELLEQEHLERRAKLRGTFTGEIEKDSIAAFRKWWADLEKLNELDNVPWATVESEWAKATAAQIGRNNLRMQQDMTAIETIIMKHVNQIAKIIAKENPYGGIIENLQANLTKMDILFADMGTITKKQLEDGSLTKELNSRLSFLLRESEEAYTLTAEQLIDDMRREDIDAWADALTNDKNGEELKRRLLAQLRIAYDAVQDAIKKESSEIKKKVDIWWADIAPGQEQSHKDGFENVLSLLGLEEEQIKRANQLIGAGYKSEGVANKLAIKQMQIRLSMQQTYYNKMREIGLLQVNQLQNEANQYRKQGEYEKARQKEYAAAHMKRSLNLATIEEGKKLMELQKEITLATEEAQNRLYAHLKEYVGLLKDDIQGIFEATHAGESEYYNERAKLNLTGKGGPGAGTYIVIDHEGTSDATAHYEYLDEREALERQREIERENALADAWKKVFDDFNMKMNDYITDQLNAILQDASLDANTNALIKNTEALTAKTAAESAGVKEIESNKKKSSIEFGDMDGEFENTGTKFKVSSGYDHKTESAKPNNFAQSGEASDTMVVIQPQLDAESKITETIIQNEQLRAQAKIDADNAVTDAKIANSERLKESEISTSKEKTEIIIGNSKKQTKTQTSNDNDTAKSSQKTFAAMAAAANMYGIAYQAMSNENLSTTQKVEMMIVQATGQALISMLTANLAADTGEAASHAPAWVSKTLKDLGPIGGPVAIGVFTAMIGGLLGLATSKIGKSKSQIAQVTGASAGAGRLATGMLTYAEGNVNEFTDPSKLTPGRQYNVDGADGNTYRARYMGRNPRTHITNGPEFHLSGERGREMIIDAGTTRQITMNESDIWRAIQTLSNGGSLRRSLKRSRGVPAFADGNVADFINHDGYSEQSVNATISPEQAIALQLSIERQNELLERALTEGIKGVFNVHGPDGLVANYDKGKKTAMRHGERH